MNWINNVVRPKIRNLLQKREVPENLWIKCPESGEMVFHRDLESNQWVIPSSDYHMKMPWKQRLQLFFDDGAYDLVPTPQTPVDPLKFRDGRRYTDRLRDGKTKSGLDDSVIVTSGLLEQLPVTVTVQDFGFMGGSLGMAAGEAIITGFETAQKNRTPLILFVASGGARMQEGVLSLMQMPRTTIAARALKQAGLPYIVVLTNPTTGGVTASYAMLGDIHIAEPDALIGFAGQRVIEQTIREKLPSGFQRAEYLCEHGMVDMVVHRHDMRETVARVCKMLMNAPAGAVGAPVSAETSGTAEISAEREEAGQDPDDSQSAAQSDLDDTVSQPQ